jgi:hypothetical protein
MVRLQHDIVEGEEARVDARLVLEHVEARGSTRRSPLSSLALAV